MQLRIDGCLDFGGRSLPRPSHHYSSSYVKRQLIGIPVRLQVFRYRRVNQIIPPCLWWVSVSLTKERSKHVHTRARAGTGSVCSTSSNRGSLKLLSDPARFHPARTRYLSQRSAQFLFLPSTRDRWR